MTNDNEKRIGEKLQFFMNEKIRVHIKLQDRTFLNGTIDHESKPGVYWFMDDKLKGVFLFLRDIFEVKEFTFDGVKG